MWGRMCSFRITWSLEKRKKKKKLTEGNVHSGNWEMWISSKLFLDQLNAWINQKLVSGEVFIVKREFNRRHYKYNILHFLIRELDFWTWLRYADASGIRLPFNYNHRKNLEIHISRPTPWDFLSVLLYSLARRGGGGGGGVGGSGVLPYKSGRGARRTF